MSGQPIGLGYELLRTEQGEQRLDLAHRTERGELELAAILLSGLGRSLDEAERDAEPCAVELVFGNRRQFQFLAVLMELECELIRSEIFHGDFFSSQGQGEKIAMKNFRTYELAKAFHQGCQKLKLSPHACAA